MNNKFDNILFILAAIILILLSTYLIIDLLYKPTILLKLEFGYFKMYLKTEDANLVQFAIILFCGTIIAITYIWNYFKLKIQEIKK